MLRLVPCAGAYAEHSHRKRGREQRMKKGKKHSNSTQKILTQLDARLARIEAQLSPKRGLAFFACLPPSDVVRRAVDTLGVTGDYSGFSAVLASYYGIPPPRFLHDAIAVPKDAIACYSFPLNTVYSKQPSLLRDTAFHEFFHALEKHGVVAIPIEKREEYANLFAKICCCRMT